MNKSFKLNNDLEIPAIGLGTWKSKNELVGDAIKYAILNAGYKHIDCASVYKNEKEIGVAFSELFNRQIKREDIFITSKLWNTEHRAENVLKACKQTLSDLQLDYLDLYLIHWNIAFKQGNDIEPIDSSGYIQTERVSTMETWKAMEELVELGLVKSIGVSNFTATGMLDLLSYCQIRPAVNQIELHPYNTQEELVNWLNYENILAIAYSPLGTPGGLKANDFVLLEDKKVIEIAQRYKKTPAQILLNWGISRDTAVIPKSISNSRIEENINSLNFELSKDDINEISSLNRNYRFVNPINWWKVPYFS